MNSPDTETSSFVDRAPATTLERLLANSRPQPAIPSVLVFMLFVLLPMLAQGQQADAGGWMPLLVAAGIVVSCGLAVAAGFCSVFPQAVWIALAGWSMSKPLFAAMPAYNRILVIVGILLAAAMFFYQIWRARTGKFVPTIREQVADNTSEH